MKNPFAFIVFMLGLAYLLYIGYLLWFRLDEYLNKAYRQKKRVKRDIPILSGFLEFGPPYKSRFNILWTRIVVLISIMICIAGIIAAIHGPF